MANVGSPYAPLLGAQIGAAQAAGNAQISGLNQGLAVDQGSTQAANQYLQQQYGLTQQGQNISAQQLALQGTEAAQGINNTNALYGLTQKQDALQSAYNTQNYGFEQTGNAESLANLQANYGIQNAGFDLNQTEYGQQQQQGLQANTSNAIGNGTIGTQSYGRANTQTNQTYQNQMAQLGLNRQSANQAYKYGVQQNQLTGQEQAAQYQYGQNNLGITEQQQALGNQYANEQYGDTQKSLALQQQQQNLSNQNAALSEQYGIQQNNNNYAGQVANYQSQLGNIYSGEQQNAGALLSSILSALG